jgi:anti-sigma factor RsiW
LKPAAPAKPIATQAAALNDYSPATVSAAVKKSDTKKKGTVVRPAPGLLGFLAGAR